MRISAETCPHYLTFMAEEIPEGATQYKCCPPIREAGNRDLLWEDLRDGTIDMVVSDHSPSTAELKHFETGDFGTAWGGISSLQLGLGAVWTEALHHKNPVTPYAGRTLIGTARGTWLRGVRIDLDEPAGGQLL